LYRLRAILCAANDPVAMLQWMARLAAGSYCEYCIVDLVEHKKVRRIEIAHADASLVDRLRALADAFVPTRGGRLERMLLTGEPELVRPRARTTHATDFWEGNAITSYVAVPIKVGGELVAIMTCASSRKAFDEEALSFAIEIAAWCGLALQTMRAPEWGSEPATGKKRRLTDAPPSMSRRTSAS
jgi:GAF domain-containing protein